MGSASTVSMPRAPGKIRAHPLSTGEQELAGHREGILYDNRYFTLMHKILTFPSSDMLTRPTL